MNALTTTNPSTAFRAKAADLMTTAARMSLHELLDEFMRLTSVMEENTAEDEEGGYPRLNDTGQLAARERRMILAASRSRFGVSFDEYDRNVGSDGNAYPI